MRSYNFYLVPVILENEWGIRREHSVELCAKSPEEAREVALRYKTELSKTISAGQPIKSKITPDQLFQFHVADARDVLLDFCNQYESQS